MTPLRHAATQICSKSKVGERQRPAPNRFVGRILVLKARKHGAVLTSTMPLEHLLTVKEVAALLRVSTQTLYKMLENAEIPAVRVGSQWRFDKDRVKEWISNQASQTTTRATGASED